MILLATGFEETAVVYCLDHMREAGLPVSLVGLSAGILKGFHGLAIRPDYSLDQLPSEVAPQGIIVPGSSQCASALVRDPRVHRLLDTTIQQAGFVAVLATAVPLFTPSISPQITTSPRFFRQGEMEIHQFADFLIDYILT